MPPAPVRIPSQRSLAPSFNKSCLSAYDKGDNGMIPGAVHPGIYLTAEENPGKPQLEGRRLRLCHQRIPQMGSLASK